MSMCPVTKRRHGSSPEPMSPPRLAVRGTYRRHMSEPRDASEKKSPLLTGLRRLGVVLFIPLVAAALLWWLPSSLTQTRWISLGVIVVALAGWYFWREED